MKMTRQARALLCDAIMQICPLRQRANDCAIWSLSTYLSKPYSDVLLAAERVNPGGAADVGLYMEDIVKIARRLGVKLSYVQSINLEEDSGIIGVTYHDLKQPGHVAVLKRGQILDANGDSVCIWDADAYFTHFQAKPDELLRLPKPRGRRT